MGSYTVDLKTVESSLQPFTVIYTQDLPLSGNPSRPAGFHYYMLFSKDAFVAADECISGLGGYGTIIAVLDGHPIPICIGSRTFVWHEPKKYTVVPINRPTLHLGQKNPANLVPTTKARTRKSRTTKATK